jgi:serine/threonine protein kinase
VDPRDKAQRLAERIADGSAVDWTSDGSSSSGDADVSSLADELRTIDEIATLHRVPRDEIDSEPPATWGPLTIQSSIGEGRFGQVFLAWDARLQRRVALKLLHDTPASAAASASSPIHEARLLARVRHPNVLTVHGADVFDDARGHRPSGGCAAGDGSRGHRP